MASKYNVCDDANNVSWPLIKYTKLVGTRLEIPVTPGQAMVIIYNKNRCYLSVMFNSSTLEEFSLALNPRPTMRSKEKDIFIQVSSACLVGEKVYEVLKPVKYPEVRHYSESFETVAPSFSQNSGERMLNCLETSKTADQTVPFSTSDMEMAATQPNVNLPLAAHFNAVSSKNYVQQNRQSVGVQTEKCLSVSDLLNDSSRLEEYLKEKLQDHQFMQLVEKCSQIYHTVFRTAEASSHVSSIEPIIPAKTRRRFKKTK
ncbi:unnamed protein product [Cercopithifilaria johnstoni]|uniref:Uncharacterized protein n=1 Tax=Cercopithifilaria johnstoni TaxID=2874296 RepID=A0A8J2LWZ8_9BILA|nr:unnamed protein product [Cercopithifilaria johnstoni]